MPPLMSGTQALPGLLTTPSTVTRARLSWGPWLVWIGRGCLMVFAAVALISTNRVAGLLTVGALTQMSSPVRGEVQVGVVFLLPPLGAALWLAGHWLMPAAHTP